MKLVSDIKTKKWTIEEEEFLPYCIDIKIGFRNNGSLPAVFDNLSFGYLLTLNNTEISKKSRPNSN
jgi:hypothetical protein